MGITKMLVLEKELGSGDSGFGLVAPFLTIVINIRAV
jgi:hypothetical protein